MHACPAVFHKKRVVEGEEYAAQFPIQNYLLSSVLLDQKGQWSSQTCEDDRNKKSSKKMLVFSCIFRIFNVQVFKQKKWKWKRKKIVLKWGAKKPFV